MDDSWSSGFLDFQRMGHCWGWIDFGDDVGRGGRFWDGWDGLDDEDEIFGGWSWDGMGWI